MVLTSPGWCDEGRVACVTTCYPIPLTPLSEKVYRYNLNPSLSVDWFYILSGIQEQDE